MDALPYLLPLAAGLLAVVAWLARARRPPPAPPVAVVSTIEEAHARTVERVEVDARAVVDDAERVDALPGRERNRAIGRGLRK